LEEQELIDRLVKGDEKAYRYLVDTYKDRVFNTLLGMLQHWEDAEDLSQEVFIEVFKSVSGFKGQSKLSTWLYRVAISKALDYRKYKGRKKRFAFVLSIFGLEGNEPVHDKPNFFHPGVELENKERAAELLKAINALPDLQRTAFTLHKVESMSYQEVAEIMETTVGAVESLIHRAKQNLRKTLETYYKQDKS
jgi:RNA polymerase sigma factor (sigma-70 family)